MTYQKRLYIDIFCAFWGENFSPKKLQDLTGLDLVDSNEVGDPNKIGIADYGAASLYPPDDYDDSESNVLDWFLDNINTYHQIIRNCGVEDITLWITYPLEGQMSWSFSASTMKLIGDLGIDICFMVDERQDKKESGVFEFENFQLLRFSIKDKDFENTKEISNKIKSLDFELNQYELQ